MQKVPCIKVTKLFSNQKKSKKVTKSNIHKLTSIANTFCDRKKSTKRTKLFKKMYF